MKAIVLVRHYDHLALGAFGPISEEDADQEITYMKLEEIYTNLDMGDISMCICDFNEPTEEAFKEGLKKALAEKR